jgi:hypothetical protein
MNNTRERVKQMHTKYEIRKNFYSLDNWTLQLCYYMHIKKYI